MSLEKFCFICRSRAVVETGFAGQPEGSAFDNLCDLLEVPWLRNTRRLGLGVKQRVKNSDFCDACEVLVDDAIATEAALKSLQVKLAELKCQLRQILIESYGREETNEALERSHLWILGRAAAQCWNECRVDLGSTPRKRRREEDVTSNEESTRTSSSEIQEPVRKPPVNSEEGNYGESFDEFLEQFGFSPPSSPHEPDPPSDPLFNPKISSVFTEAHSSTVSTETNNYRAPPEEPTTDPNPASQISPSIPEANPPPQSLPTITDTNPTPPAPAAIPGPKPPEAFPCSYCDRVFGRPVDLGTHKKNRHYEMYKLEWDGMARCKHCGLDFNTACLLSLDESTGTRKYICNAENCAQTFEDIRSLEKHHRNKCRGRKNPTTWPTCKFCGLKFREIKYHIQEVHFNQFDFHCDQCDYKSNRRSAITAHKKNVHERKKPFVCDICEEGFFHAAQLARHRRSHGDEPTYSCEICSSAFYILQALNLHRQTEHPEVTQPKFKCRHCALTFDLPRDLHRHYQQEHPVDIGTLPFKCKDCEKSYLVKFQLNQHIKTAHPPPAGKQKPKFSCDLCIRSFADSERLEVHRKAVHNCFPVTCPICKKVNRSIIALQEHLRKVHKQDWREWIDEHTGECIQHLDSVPEVENLKMRELLKI